MRTLGLTAVGCFALGLVLGAGWQPAWAARCEPAVRTLDASLRYVRTEPVAATYGLPEVLELWPRWVFRSEEGDRLLRAER